MANPKRGEVALILGDQTYTLSFSVSALCELEDALDMPVSKIGDLLNDAANLRMDTVRKVIWAALRDHHEEIDVKQAGKLATNIPLVMNTIGEAFQLAFPSEGNEPRPPKAKAS
ncbi:MULTISPECIES: GTA-gp10 family protein [Brucella]|uniref:GTA-gp10 family protein n=1 Tax=Brucella TaxID=234 RepID=UPI003BA1F523